MESEDGEGMEPPNSVQDDHSPVTGEDGQATGFSIIDGREDSATDEADVTEVTGEDASEETATASDGATGSDGDELSVDQWLAAADGEEQVEDEDEDEETDPETGVALDTETDSDSDSKTDVASQADLTGDDEDDVPLAAAAADPGANMSDIMAELLAAAEKSAEADDAAATDAADEAAAAAIAAPEKPKRPTADADTGAGADADADTEKSDAEISETGKSETADEDETKADETTGADSKTSDSKSDKSGSKNDQAEDDKTAEDKADTEKTGDEKTDADETGSDSKSADSKTSDKADDKNAEADKTGKDETDKKKAGEDKNADGKKAKGDEKADSKKAKDDKEADGDRDGSAGKDQKSSKTDLPGVLLAKTEAKGSSFPVLKAGVATVIGLYALLVAAWGVDMARHSDQAMRGVELATVDVGGLDRDELSDTIDDLTNELGDRDVEVTIGEEQITTDPVTLGARFDRDRMIDESLAARRSGAFFVRPVTWAIGLFSTEAVEARYLVDTDVAGAAATEVLESELDQPVEPTLELQGSRMTVTPGAPGVTVEPREIVGRLPAAIEEGEPYELTLIPRDADPEIETATIAELADEINERTEEPIAIQVLDDEIEVSPRMQKTWIDLDLDEDDPTWVVSEDRALEDLKPLFPGLGSEDQQATFKIVNEKPIIIPAAESVICCEAGIGDDLRRTIDRGLPAMVTEEDETGEEVEVQPLRTITLEPEITAFDEGVAELESLGIVELVSTFTTKHACCANRVKNIQRFADLTQGVIIRPGDEFSLNGFVGRRTRENGFVADGAIALGNFEQQVGGGISQYATTFFNASFFAGVEFLEYQSHSIYISRYPRGREATISWRKPDLKIRNNTEYGILVWNEYTPTSITVSFYSTKHLAVEALPLRRSSDRQCRIDITPRLITAEDGSQSEDSVFALYRPGEGLDCNGNSTTPDKDPPAPAAPVVPAPAPAPAPTPEPEPEPAPGPPEPDGGEVLP